ncbi:diguanylate cyclase domain-containing protein [Thiomicrorhabdus sp.]|uniref:GGDEF domain-containing protein n=1 Tax=Thiomicrorhabdus sp. TaxID=2039724 RepID=UPI0035683CCA
MQQVSFRKLMRKQILLAIAISLLISAPITLIPGYFIFTNNIQNELERLETHSYQEINQQLSTGWQPRNVERILSNLNRQMPEASFYLQKAPTFLKDQKTDSTLGIIQNPAIQTLVKDVEKTLQPTIQTRFFEGYLYAAYPIKFKDKCLSCHAREVAEGTIYPGLLAGTIAFKAPISVSHLSSASLLIFFLIFIVTFVFIALILSEHFLQQKLLTPIKALSLRIANLKLDTHHQSLDWQRTPQEVAEIDWIDENITENIQTIQRIYSKLDALIVTEHETGLFHRNRFNEVIQYELLRSRRYQHRFSVITVKLLHVKHLQTQTDQETPKKKQKEAEVQAFSRLLMLNSRVTDFVFRITEDLFVIVAPETDQEGAKIMRQHLSQRLETPKESSENQSAEQQENQPPLYEFEFQLGYATYEEDGLSAKQIIHEAIKRMQASDKAIRS